MSGLMERVSAAWDGLRGKALPTHPIIEAWLRGQEDRFGADEITQPYRQHPWIKAAVTAISRAIARPEFQVWRGDRRIDLEQPNHPLVKILKRPRKGWTERRMRFGTAVFQELNGDAIWVLETGRKNPRPQDPVVEIRMPSPTRMDFETDKVTGEIKEWILDKNKPTQQRFAPFEVIHFSLFNPFDDIRGLEAISAVKRAMNLDHHATKHLVNLMRHGPSIGTYLFSKDKLDEPTARRVQRTFDRSHSGSDRAGKRTPVMTGGIDLKTAQPSNRELQLAELIQLGIREFAAGMLVPPILLGDYSRATFANSNVQERVLYEWNAIPKTEEYRDLINCELTPRYGDDLSVVFDFSGIQALQRTLQDEVTAAKTMFDMAVPLSVIENLFDFGLDLKKIPWAETAFVNSSLIDANALLGEPPLPTAPASNGDKGLPASNGDRRIRCIEGVPKRQDRLAPALNKGRILLWEKTARPMIRPEIEFRKLLNRHFFKLRSETLRKIRSNWKRLVLDRKKQDKGLAPTKSPTGLANLFKFDLEAAARSGQAILEPVYGEVVENAARGASAELGLAIGPAFEVPAGVRATLASIPGRVKGFDNFVWDRLSRTIEEGIVKGSSEKNIAAAVKTRFKLSAFQHAPTIARTEVATAFNITRQSMFVEAGVQRHQWLTSRDDRVRDSHAAQDGETIKIGEIFGNGLLYPNDPTGEAGEVINCRCIALPVFEGEQSAGVEDLRP